MSTVGSTKRESPLLVLMIGLLMVVVLQAIAVRAVVASPVLGLGLGAAELLLGWRISATSGSRALRWILVIFGAATLALAVFYAVFQPD